MISIFNSCTDNEKDLKNSLFKITNIKSDSLNYFIYIPPNQCKSCLILDCDSTYSNMKNRIHLILNQDTTYFHGFTNAYLEEDKLLFSNSLVNSGNKIIVTAGENIVEIQRFESLEWLKNYDKKYYKY